jgi:hypothetical protein
LIAPKQYMTASGCTSSGAPTRKFSLANVVRSSRAASATELFASTQMIHDPLRIVMVGGVACDSQAGLGRHGGC